MTINHPENARTGTVAVGPRGRAWPLGARLLGAWRRYQAVAPSAPTPAELVVVDLVAQHHVKTNQQAAGEGDFGLGPPAPPADGEVSALEFAIGSGGQRCGLTEYPAQQGAALFADVSQAVLISRGVDRRGQSDVADDVLAAGKPSHGAEHQHGRQGRERTNSGVSHEPARMRISRHDGSDVDVELVDPTIKPLQQLEAIVAPAGRVGQEHQRVQLRQATAGPQRGPRGRGAD